MSKGAQDRLPFAGPSTSRAAEAAPAVGEALEQMGSTRTEHVHRRLVRGFRATRPAWRWPDPDCTAMPKRPMAHGASTRVAVSRLQRVPGYQHPWASMIRFSRYGPLCFEPDDREELRF